MITNRHTNPDKVGGAKGYVGGWNDEDTVSFMRV